MKHGITLTSFRTDLNYDLRHDFLVTVCGMGNGHAKFGVPNYFIFDMFQDLEWVGPPRPPNGMGVNYRDLSGRTLKLTFPHHEPYSDKSQDSYR